MYAKRLFRHPFIPKPLTLATSQLKCDFDGTVAVGSPYTEPNADGTTSRNFIKDLTGTDSNGTVYPTSFAAFFGANTKTRIQSIPCEAISGANDAAKKLVLDTLFSNEIRTLDAPVEGKTKYLRSTIISRTTAAGTSPSPQTDPVILRSGSIGTDIKRFCVKHTLRLPPNLEDLLYYPSPSNARWLTLQDFKKGGYSNQNGVGDYRFKLEILKDGTGLFFRISGDNAANGQGVIPSIEADNNSTGGFWNIPADNTQVPVFLDEWLEFWTYIKSPELKWTRETPGDTNTPYERELTTGRTVTVMRRISTGQWYLIGEQIGDIQIGCENLFWARLFFLTYYNGDEPIYVDNLGLEFFDNLPFTLESKGLA